MFKHILIPTDGSALSKQAVLKGIAFAKSINAKVTGLYAAPEYHLPTYGEAYIPSDLVSEEEYKKDAKSKAEKYLAAIENAAKQAGVACECTFVFSDHPWEAITKTAKKKKCDLIFMASHGRRGLAALLLGSETNKVLVHSEIPVLVYR